MDLGFRLDDRFWLYVPPEFSEDAGETREEWRENALRRYVSANADTGADERIRVEQLVDAAHATVAQGSDFGLQFWPVREPIALLFQAVGIDLATADVDPLAVLLDGIHLAAAPVIHEIGIAGADRAFVVKFLAAPDSAAPRASLAGLAAVIEYGSNVVLLRSEPTSSTMVGIAEGPLRELVSTFVPA